MKAKLLAQVGIFLLGLVAYESAADAAGLPRIGPALDFASSTLRAGFHQCGEAVARASSLILYLKVAGFWSTAKGLAVSFFSLIGALWGFAEGYAAESSRQAEPAWIAVGSLILYVVLNNAWIHVTGQKPLLTLLGIAVGKAWLAVVGPLGMRRRYAPARKASYGSSSSEETSSESEDEETEEEEELPKPVRRPARAKPNKPKRRAATLVNSD